MSVTGAMLRMQAIQARIAGLGASSAAPSGATAATETPFASTLDRHLQSAAPPLPPTAASPAQPAVGGAEPYEEEIRRAADEAGVPASLVRAVCRAESGYDPRAVSRVGAQGLMQLMPSTAAGLGVTDPFDPAQSLRGGARYLRAQLDRFGGDVAKAVAAYNAGPGAVERYGGVPPYAETQRYVSRVLAAMAEYDGAARAPAAGPAPGAGPLEATATARSVLQALQAQLAATPPVDPTGLTASTDPDALDGAS